MKISYLVVVLTVSALFASPAFSNSTECSSSDSRLVFKSETPNGGPMRPGTESLVLDGETLISFTWPGGANLKIAEISFAPETVWSKTTASHNNSVTQYLVKAAVSRLDASGSALPVFDDLVFCREDRYTGPPIP